MERADGSRHKSFLPSPRSLLLTSAQFAAWAYQTRDKSGSNYLHQGGVCRRQEISCDAQQVREGKRRCPWSGVGILTHLGDLKLLAAAPALSSTEMGSVRATATSSRSAPVRDSPLKGEGNLTAFSCGKGRCSCRRRFSMGAGGTSLLRIQVHTQLAEDHDTTSYHLCYVH